MVASYSMIGAKLSGGSSSINGMCFIRGNALDYEGWRQAGCEGWSYADVLPYFTRMESYSGGADEFRGTEGPLHVQRAASNRTLGACILGGRCAQAGYQTTDDISGYCQEGFGVFDRTVFKGQRWSASRAYLDPARGRDNLTIVTRALVQRLSLSGDRVTGVVYRDRHGALVTVRTRQEVLLLRRRCWLAPYIVAVWYWAQIPFGVYGHCCEDGLAWGGAKPA